MAIYWMTEVMPLAVTAMLPVVLFPLTGVLDCNTTAKEFMNVSFSLRETFKSETPLHVMIIKY